MRVDEAIYLPAGYGANINPNNPVAEAVKMGIEALEGLPSAEPERKKGTWLLTDSMYACNRCHSVFYETSPFCPNCGAEMKGAGMIKAEWINADALDLQPTCNQLATDLISRQAVIDQLHQSYNLLDAEQRLEDLPSVQPEIIRCKDCVKFHEPTCLMAYDGREWADYMGFCHGGERDADGSDR